MIGWGGIVGLKKNKTTKIKTCSASGTKLNINGKKIENDFSFREKKISKEMLILLKETLNL